MHATGTMEVRACRTVAIVRKQPAAASADSSSSSSALDMRSNTLANRRPSAESFERKFQTLRHASLCHFDAVRLSPLPLPKEGSTTL